MRAFLFLSMFLAFGFFVSCDEEIKDPPPKNNDEPIELCDTLEATYDGSVSAVLNTNCAVSGCHVGVAPSAGINLSNYDDAKFIAQTPNFLGAVKHENGFTAMPFQKAKLEQQYIDILECWVSKGFPQN